ncbi:cardiolipin synthase [Paeniglutamicibacter terrestris]|uniref:Cardiolipin synthase n=1 Tax=Paeniglutamicibacter terrestris TaxID=2723403 RepID=A0ABX1G3Z6_9MICC|nr:cardiolipin synthase [Paeniglutamicibacter terrestris]NKG20694.1 cardiolipin synthase [Paeniglutamicibacter terrestris]
MSEIDIWALLLGITHVVLGLLATVLVSRNRKPAEAIAWVMMIVFIPFLGVAAYLLIGFGRLPAHRRAKQREVNELMLRRTGGSWPKTHSPLWPNWLSSAAELNMALGALPMVGGNRITLNDDYLGTIKEMAEAIDDAQEHVHVQFYIGVLDDATAPFFGALARACERGVQVRVLVDHVASLMYPRRTETIRFLDSIGAQLHQMLPLRPWRGQWQRPDLRNHRKLLVIDGSVGFTGSMNLIEPRYHKAKNIQRGLTWHELMMRIEGPAVRELDAVFITDWYSETGTLLELRPPSSSAPTWNGNIDAQVLPSGPSFENDNSLKLFTLMIHQATTRVSITSPYFVPDESILLAILTTAARGVPIELFVSEIGDQALVHHAQRSYYEALLRAGVRIYLYRAPKVLHAKHFSIDDEVAIVGSSNMDMRSFSLNMEVSVLLHGPELLNDLLAVQDGYRERSRELHLEEWLSRTLWQRTADNLARLTSMLQ